VEGFFIGGGVNGYRFYAHFFTGTDDAEGNFSAIGNEYFFKHKLVF
jgi:hypothetical protein